MTKKLPLNLRLDVRRFFDEPKSGVNLALKSLNSLIDSHFFLEIAWDDIHRDLRKLFANDIEELIPSVARHIGLFLVRLKARVDQDEVFQSKFIDNQVQDGLQTTCKIVNHQLTLQLPTTGEEGFRKAQASIGSDLANLFDQLDETSHLVGGGDAVRNGTDANSASLKRRWLPSLQSLDRPEVLFEDLLPAYLTVKGHDQDVYIEGTHAPTITLIAEYFEKYARKDMQSVNQSPRFTIELMTSNFGSGTMNDCIHIELANRNREWRINIAMFLTFIEGICGYDMVDAKSGSYVFKRTRPL